VVSDGADDAGTVIGGVDVDAVGALALWGIDRRYDGPRDVGRIGVRGRERSQALGDLLR